MNLQLAVMRSAREYLSTVENWSINGPGVWTSEGLTQVCAMQAPYRILQQMGSYEIGHKTILKDIFDTLGKACYLLYGHPWVTYINDDKDVIGVFRWVKVLAIYDEAIKLTENQRKIRSLQAIYGR